ncbi:MAG: hypothetical protein ACE5JM_14180, partial [Armatimonadota bacterium]
MKRTLIFTLLSMVSLPAAANLVTNPGFEDGMTGWETKLRGEWTKKVDESQIVAVSTDARSGQSALRIDTTVLNPGGTITDELRQWRPSKYEIFVTQKVTGLKPSAWYLATFRVRSPGVAIDEG